MGASSFVRSRRARVAAALAAALTVAAPAGTARADDGTWTAAPGGAVSATAPVSIRNVTKGWAADCPSASFSGSVPGGSGHSGYGLLSFDQAAFTGCTGPNGLSVTVTVDNLPWDFYADAYDAGRGKATGTFNNLYLTLDVSNGCRMDVSAPDGAPGSTDAAHTNGDHTLSLSGARLGTTFTNFKCTGAFAETGDTIELSSALPITPGQTLTSP